MEIYQHFIGENSGCIVCGTSEEKPSTLLMVKDTREGNKALGYPVHISCLNPVIVMDATFKEMDIEKGIVIVQIIPKEMISLSKM